MHAKKHTTTKTICVIENCEGQVWALGFCTKHLHRFRRYGSPHITHKKPNGSVCSQICAVEECQRNAKGTFKDGKVYCTKHLHRMKRYNDPYINKIPLRGELAKEIRRKKQAIRQRNNRKTVAGKLRSRFNNAKRRLLRNEGTMAFPKEAFLRLWSGTVCGICRQPISDDEKILDHIIPLSKGGTNDPTNIQLAHKNCNLKKCAKVLPTGLLFDT